MKKLEDLSLKKTNLKINYEDWIDNKNDQTIVILHGWGGSSQSWLNVAQLLFNSGFNVIVPDLPGFGKTRLEKVFDLEEYAIVVEQFIKELSIDNVILWGHSNGGAIALKISDRKKINISRLILNNSAGIRNDKKRSMKRKILSFLVKYFKFLKRIFMYKKIRILFYKLIGGQDYLNAENNPNLKQTYLNIIKSDLSDIIKNISNNTLIIWGKNDTYTPLSDGLFMRKHIKKSKMVILEDEKHGIHLTSPEKLVNKFLENI